MSNAVRRQLTPSGGRITVTSTWLYGYSLLAVRGALTDCGNED